MVGTEQCFSTEESSRNLKTREMNVRSLAVVIHGSPRRGGNTDTLLGQLVRGIQSTAPDVSVKEIHTSQMKIGPCRECRACDTTGCCIVDDDMQQLYPVLPEADILILSSPIFFYSLSGWAKAW